MSSVRVMSDELTHACRHFRGVLTGRDVAPCSGTKACFATLNGELAFEDGGSIDASLRSLDEAELFNTLFSLARFVNTECLAAFTATSLLERWKPTCSLAPKDAVGALLDHWNVSCKEVPRYLADVLGRDTILAAAESLEREQLSASQRGRLHTVAYWLDARIEPPITPCHWRGFSIYGNE